MGEKNNSRKRHLRGLQINYVQEFTREEFKRNRVNLNNEMETTQKQNTDFRGKPQEIRKFMS